MKRLCLAAALAAFATFAAAQSWPAKPVRLILQFPPGGSTDVVARVLGQALSQSLGQPVIVENKPGADGAIAGDSVARAEPDGYTYFLASNTAMMQVPLLKKNAPYDAVRSFTPVSLVGRYVYVLVVSPALPAKNVAELIDYARANPGRLAYGTPGSGTAHHLNFELFLTRIGARMVHVPYKGAAPMTADLVSGNLQVAFAALSSAMPLVSAGKIRVLAVADEERVPQAKDVPAIAETLKGYSAHVWFGLMAPARTPEPVTARLASEMNAAVNLPDVKERLTGLGYQVKPTSPAQMMTLMTSEYEKWGQVIKAAGIKPE
jgi:tripartite-type tricarboxylate transporter receptor subunit TctC